VLAGQVPAHPFDLLTIGQVGGDAVGLAVLGQGLDGVVDLAGVLADDDGGAAGGHDVDRGLASHPAAAADDHQFLAGEDRHGRRHLGLVRVTVLVLEPVPVRAHFQSFLSVRWVSTVQLCRRLGRVRIPRLASHDG
jgi:hypothetical protein